MAGVVAIRAMFECIGFTLGAATLLTDEQGIDSLNEVFNMDDENIENLCKVLRRPGGHNDPGNPDPGVKVSARAEENLKLAAFYCRHQERVSRPMNVALITLNNIRKLTKQRDKEKVKNHDVKDTPVAGVPLSYVIRRNIKPLPSDANPSKNYATFEHEMVARAPIVVPGSTGGESALEVRGPFTQSYITDRSEVWAKLATILGSSECWTYAKVARLSRDGRLCLRSVYNHYLDLNNIDHLASRAERKVSGLNISWGSSQLEF